VLERLVLVGLMFAGAKGFSYVYARVFGALLQVFMLWYFARWNPAAMLLDSIRTGWQGRADLRFGFKVQLKTVSNILQTSIIPGAGNRLFDVQTVGLLAWANNTAYTLGQSLPQAVGRVIVGSNSRYQGEPAGFRRLVEQALGFCTIFCGSVLALTAALLPELLLYLFNPRWSGAAGLFALACLPMLQAILLIVYDALLLAGGRPLSTAFWNWITGGLAFGFSVGLGNWIGPPGIFLALFLANLVPLAAYHRLTRAQHPLALGRSFFLPATWSTAGGFAVFFFKGHFVQGWPSLLAYGAVGFLLVAGSYFAWHRDQLAALLSLFGGRRKA